MDVGRWLDEIGMGDYAQLFEEHRIERDVLTELTADDLRDLGIPLGDRKRLMKALEELTNDQTEAINAHSRLAAQSAPVAERRQLTVVFCDMVGSTELSERLDPEDMREVLQAYHNTCADVVSQFAGHIAKLIGDGVLIYFGYPQAREDDARRAVQACLLLVTAIRGLSKSLSLPTVAEMDVRIGVHTGLVVIGEMIGGDMREAAAIVGETPNLASRLQGVAQPGGIVVSQSTHRLVSGHFSSRPLGELVLKGLSRPVSAFAIEGITSAQTNFDIEACDLLSPLVGRDEEVDLLYKRWNLSREGDCQLVLLSGEAGIGKSRIIRGLRDRLVSHDHNRILYYGSPYHSQTAYHPIIDQLQRALRYGSGDSTEEKLVKLCRVLENLQLPLNPHRIALAALLSLRAVDSDLSELTSEKLRAGIIRSMIAVVQAMTRQEPVLMVVEDAHLFDPSSLEYIDLLTRQSQSARLMIVVAFRPEMDGKWANNPHATFLKLNRLARRDTERMIRGFLGDHAVASEIVELIAERADGVPLFVEELTRSMQELEQIVLCDGRYELADRKSELLIPTSLHDSLAARLDRLGPARATAQLAATLGRSFRRDVLTAVSPLPSVKLRADLTALINADLINHHGTETDLQYEFRHALVRDAAYQSLLKSDRRDAHRRIAKEISENFTEIATTQPELLARHYTKAGMLEEATNYWWQAGENAAQRSANVEAVSHFTNAVEQLLRQPSSPQRDRQEFTLQVALGSAYLMTRGVVAPEVERAFARAKELAPHVEDWKKHFNALWGYYYVFEMRAQWTDALDNISELVALAESENDPGLKLQAHHAAWTAHALSGNLVTALQHVDQGHPLYQAETHHHHKFHYGGHDPHVCCHSVGGIVRLLTGNLAAGFDDIDTAVRLAVNMDHPTTEMVATFFHSVGNMFLRDAARALEMAQRTMQLGKEHGNIAFIKMGSIMVGNAKAALDPQSEGADQMASVLASARKHKRTTFLQSFYLGQLAEAYFFAGNLENARAALQDAFHMVEVQNEHIWESELHRLNGEFLLAENAKAIKNAEAAFRKAIEVAGAQQAKSLELRASTSLARMLGESGRRSEAKRLLEPIVKSIFESQTSNDINAAKTLFSQLI